MAALSTIVNVLVDRKHGAKVDTITTEPSQKLAELETKYNGHNHSTLYAKKGDVDAGAKS